MGRVETDEDDEDDEDDDDEEEEDEEDEEEEGRGRRREEEEEEEDEEPICSRPAARRAPKKVRRDSFRSLLACPGPPKVRSKTGSADKNLQRVLSETQNSVFRCSRSFRGLETRANRFHIGIPSRKTKFGPPPGSEI